jgi:hypothetical protein
MLLLVVIALVALVAFVGCALGEVVGPAVFGLGFAGFGMLLLMSGIGSPGPAIGLVYLCGSVVEFAAAGEFRRWNGTKGGPPRGWRVWAALVGVAGSLLIVLLLIALAYAAMMSVLI